MPVTEPGSLVGTTDMSPEQARGQEVDVRSDIWSLGVVLYEMVAYRHPFAGGTRADVLVAVLDREPALLPDANRHLPAELQRIVGRALRKDPDERYQVMKDLMLDLEALRTEVASGDRSRASDPQRDVAARLTGWAPSPSQLVLHGRACGGVCRRDAGSSRRPRVPPCDVVLRITRKPLQLVVAACVAEDDIVAGSGEQESQLAAHQPRPENANPHPSPFPHCEASSPNQ
jgi:serine/threonine protein kinase